MDNKHDKKRKAAFDTLIKAAEQSFTDIGYRSTTVAGIIHRTKYSRATYYTYFDSKDQLAALIIERIITDIDIYIQREKTLTQAIRIQNWKYVFAVIYQYKPILNGLIGSQRGSLIIRERFLKYSQQLMEKEFDKKLFKTTDKKIPKDLIISYISNAFMGCALWSIESENQLSSDSLAEQFFILIKDSLRHE